MSKVPIQRRYHTPVAFCTARCLEDPQVINSRDPMPSAQQNAQEGRQAIHPRDPSRQSSHHRCLPQSKMPKEAHKPPNTPGIQTSIVPSSKSSQQQMPKKAHPSKQTSHTRTKISQRMQIPITSASHKQQRVSVVVPIFPHVHLSLPQLQVRVSAQRPDVMTMHGTARQDCNPVSSSKQDEDL